MNVSRKEFLRKGLLSLGELVFKFTGVLRTPAAVESMIQDERDPEPVAGAELRAVAHNERCLAGSCGCFVCAERCESQAITVIMGEGIGIDKAACIGCGTCNQVCPVLPKAVLMVSVNR